MIWCFGFFFLWLLYGCDEEPHQQRETLQMMTVVTNTVQRPDSRSLLKKRPPVNVPYEIQSALQPKRRSEPQTIHRTEMQNRKKLLLSLECNAEETEFHQIVLTKFEWPAESLICHLKNVLYLCNVIVGEVLPCFPLVRWKCRLELYALNIW